MSNIIIVLLSLFSFDGPAEHAYKDKALNQTPEKGYSVIRYDLDHHNYSIPITVHKSAGCVLHFSRPYDDSWASDTKGSSTGEFFKYFEWGTGPGGSPAYKKIIISSVMPTKTTQNLFILVEDRVVEFILKQTDDFESADRKVVLNLVATEPKKKRPSRPEVSDTQSDELVSLLAMVPSSKNRQIKVPHGTLTYQFEQGQRFVYFTPKEGIPEITTLEVIRGKKSGRQFKYEVPLVHTNRFQVGRSHLLTFSNFELNKGERVYFRIKVEGERLAKTKKLRKRRV
jgi:hypothetical protein